MYCSLIKDFNLSCACSAWYHPHFCEKTIVQLFVYTIKNDHFHSARAWMLIIYDYLLTLQLVFTTIVEIMPNVTLLTATNNYYPYKFLQKIAIPHNWNIRSKTCWTLQMALIQTVKTASRLQLVIMRNYAWKWLLVVIFNKSFDVQLGSQIISYY